MAWCWLVTNMLRLAKLKKSNMLVSTGGHDTFSCPAMDLREAQKTTDQCVWCGEDGAQEALASGGTYTN